MSKKIFPHWVFIIGWIALILPAVAASVPNPSASKPDAKPTGQTVRSPKAGAGDATTKPDPVKEAASKTKAQASADSGAKFEPTDRRDPFLNPLLVSKSAKNIEDEEESRGQPPPGIAGMYIAQVKLQGISSREGSKLAVFRGSDNRAYFLQEGDKLFDGFVKNIGSDSVLLVREARLKSGKTLSQEITKRLRTP
jgi:hypothetical protein